MQAIAHEIVRDEPRSRITYLGTEQVKHSNKTSMQAMPLKTGKTIVDSGELGVNYWHSKRFRATFNYVVNHFGQGSDANATLNALASPWEQEFLFRLAIAL